jgi:hypothetical protein
MIERSRIRRVFATLGWVLLASILAWLILNQLSTPPYVTQLKVAIRASATPTETTTLTPTATATTTPTSTAAAAGAGTSTQAPAPTIETATTPTSGSASVAATPALSPSPQPTAQGDRDEPAAGTPEPVEVVITVKGEETEAPEEQQTSVTAEWSAAVWSWGQGKEVQQARLVMVVTNEGDIPLRPCLAIPAILDRESIPVAVQGAEVLFRPRAGVSSTPDSALSSPVVDICQTGIRGRPELHYETAAGEGEILPGQSETYTLVLHLAKGGKFPYTGQVNVYLPGAAAGGNEEAPRLTPYRSLPFTIRSRPFMAIPLDWQSLRSGSVSFGTNILEILAVCLVAGLLLAYGWPQWRKQVGTPNLVLDAIKTKDGQEKDAEGERLRALLEDEIDRFRTGGVDRTFSPSLVTGGMSATKFSLPSKLSEQAVLGVIVSVLEYIFKPNTIKVTGQVQSSAVKGFGLTLKLTDNLNDQILGTESFWEVDYAGLNRLVPNTDEHPFDPLALLVQAAATWVCCRSSGFVGEDYTPLGTSIWQSNAYSLCAMYMFGLITQKNAPADARVRALDLFHTALSYDQNNPVAGINYARLSFETVDDEDRTSVEKYDTYSLARARLEKVVRHLEEQQNRRYSPVLVVKSSVVRFSEEKLWLYQACYNLAVVASMQARTKAGEPPRERQFAANTLYRLAHELAAAVAGSSSLPVRTDQGGIEPKDIERLLQCVHAHEAPYARIRSMRQAIVGLLGLMRMDAGDAPKPYFARLVYGRHGSLADINYRVHYDIACYFSRGAKNGELTGSEQEACYRKSFFHLEQALQLPGDLKNYACLDEDLANLRLRHLERFNQIVNRYTETPAPAASEPASLSVVLGILGEQADVHTAEELIVAGRTPANRRSLARKSDGKLSYAVIAKWVRIADLMRLPGVDELYAALLYKVGVVSPQELKTRTPESLATEIQEFNREHKIAKRVPSATVVAGWIRAARRMADRVD